MYDGGGYSTVAVDGSFLYVHTASGLYKLANGYAGAGVAGASAVGASPAGAAGVAGPPQAARANTDPAKKRIRMMTLPRRADEQDLEQQILARTYQPRIAPVAIA